MLRWPKFNSLDIKLKDNCVDSMAAPFLDRTLNLQPEPVLFKLITFLKVRFPVQLLFRLKF